MTPYIIIGLLGLAFVLGAIFLRDPRACGLLHKPGCDCPRGSDDVWITWGDD